MLPTVASAAGLRMWLLWPGAEAFPFYGVWIKCLGLFNLFFFTNKVECWVLRKLLLDYNKVLYTMPEEKHISKAKTQQKIRDLVRVNSF